MRKNGGIVITKEKGMIYGGYSLIAQSYFIASTAPTPHANANPSTEPIHNSNPLSISYSYNFSKPKSQLYKTFPS
jgi:hypothetical protein